MLVTPQGGRHQPGLDSIELGAGIAQAGNLHHRCIAQVQPGTGR